MNILGISPFHDSSVCIVSNGKIKNFFKEERYNRLKRSSDPIISVQKALDKHKIDALAWCSPTQNENYFQNFLQNQIGKHLPETVYDFSSEHHLTHASLAFYNSGFQTASIIVIDRNGSLINNSIRESESIFSASYPCNFEKIYKSYYILNIDAHFNIAEHQSRYPNCELDIRSMYNIVKVYESATTLICQHPLENGKTMGLSSYGNKNSNGIELFHGHIPQDRHFGHKQLFDMPVTFNIDLDSHSTGKITEENFQIYADYAWQVQKQTQEAVCLLIEKSLSKNNEKNICITGGYGLNIVSNAYYLKQFPNCNFYFEPLADDSGNSIGGAMFLYRLLSKDNTIIPIKNTFFHGDHYDLSKYTGKETSVEKVAQILLENNTVGLYYSYAEAGPRSLGHRSILYNATDKFAKNVVNKIKQREWYRPFACSILEEDLSLYFLDSNLTKNKYMTVSFMANEYAKQHIPGIIHVDGSCRVHTVSPEDNILYDLLKEYKKLSGHGVLLHTSLNLAGEPLVETPDDAINLLNNSLLDFLWFPEKNIIMEN